MAKKLIFLQRLPIHFVGHGLNPSFYSTCHAVAGKQRFFDIALCTSNPWDIDGTAHEREKRSQTTDLGVSGSEQFGNRPLVQIEKHNAHTVWLESQHLAHHFKKQD